MRPGIESIITDTPRRIEPTDKARTAYLDRRIRYWAEKFKRAPARSRFRTVAAVRLNCYQSVRQTFFGERLAVNPDQEEIEYQQG